MCGAPAVGPYGDGAGGSAGVALALALAAKGVHAVRVWGTSPWPYGKLCVCHACVGHHAWPLQQCLCLLCSLPEWLWDTSFGSPAYMIKPIILFR